MIEDLQEFVKYQIERLSGPNSDDAFHSLIEAPISVLPLLINAYKNDLSLSVQAVIVDIVGQFKSETSLPFLSHALRSDDDKIWKAALDGFVSIGCENAKQILEKEFYYELEKNLKSNKAKWIKEAIGQV